MKDRDLILSALDDIALEGDHNGAPVGTAGGVHCCQTCGVAELGDDFDEYVFWHSQDEEAFDRGTLVDTLHLSYSSPYLAAVAVRELRERDIDASWNGDVGRRVEVKPGRIAPVSFAVRTP